jgi:2-polyprenyl-6-methoxyphenol hydroxylase-like FAD-dependent oxidoreductase
VLIVGAGPAELTSALALARYGVPTLTVEKHPSAAHTPCAHIIKQPMPGSSRVRGALDTPQQAVPRATPTPRSALRGGTGSGRPSWPSGHSVTRAVAHLPAGIAVRTIVRYNASR